MADPSSLPPLPKNHLDHPEQWTTGSEPATEKQKGFIAVLEKKHPDLVPEEGFDNNELGKSEASEVIDKLIKGEKVLDPKDNLDKKAENERNGGNQDEDQGAEEDTGKGEQVGEKRKERSDEEKKNSNNNKVEDASKLETKKDDIMTDKTKAATQESERDELVSSQDQNQDEDIELDGKDTKDSKQTTLDGVFDGSASPKKESVDDTHETKEEDRASKKPKLSSDSTPTKKTSSTIDTPSKASDKPNTAYTGGYNSAHPPVEADSGATYPKPTETDTIPGSPTHLDHPENWATGDEPATEKQKGFIKVLEKQKPSGSGGVDVEGLGKSEASERIEELKGM